MFLCKWAFTLGKAEISGKTWTMSISHTIRMINHQEILQETLNAFGARGAALVPQRATLPKREAIIEVHERRNEKRNKKRFCKAKPSNQVTKPEVASC